MEDDDHAEDDPEDDGVAESEVDPPLHLRRPN